MKKLILYFFALLFLSGCSSYDMYSVSEFYEGEKVYLEAEVTVRYDIDYKYVMSYTNQDGLDRTVVLEPKAFAGLKYDFASSELSMEETVLGCPLPEYAGYTPCDCLREAVAALAEKAPAAYSMGEYNGVKSVTLIFEEGDGIHSKALTVAKKDGRLLSARFFEKGNMIIEAKINSFYFKK